MHERFGSLYDSLDTKRGRGIIAYIGHYFIRRILLACAVVFSSSLFLQFALMTVTILIQISIVITVKPLKGGKFALGMEMFHEVTTMLILYTVICFSQFVPDPFTRSVMGYVSISLVSGHLLVCLGFMLTSTLLDMIEQIKNKFYQYQLSKLQKKVQELKNSRKKLAKITQHRVMLRPQLRQSVQELQKISEVSVEQTIQSQIEQSENENSMSQLVSSFQDQREQIQKSARLEQTVDVRKEIDIYEKDQKDNVGDEVISERYAKQPKRRLFFGIDKKVGKKVLSFN